MSSFLLYDVTVLITSYNLPVFFNYLPPYFLKFLIKLLILWARYCINLHIVLWISCSHMKLLCNVDLNLSVRNQPTIRKWRQYRPPSLPMRPVPPPRISFFRPSVKWIERSARSTKTFRNSKRNR